MLSSRVRVTLAAAMMLLFVAPVGQAAIRGSDLFVPSVARSPGAGGSFWYTTLWIHNTSESPAVLTISLLRRDRPNPAPEQQSMTVQPGSTVTVPDVLWDLFGLGEGAGALRVSADQQVVVGARIFNLPGDDIAESQGQFLAGTPSLLAVGHGEATDIPGITQPEDGSFRCNFGIVETTGEDATVLVTLLDGDGVELASSVYELGGLEVMQKNLSHLEGNTTVEGGRLNVQVTEGSGAVLGFASLVASGVVSQDPSTLEMEISTSSGGVTGVTAGAGLVGGGSGPDIPLAVGAGHGIEVSDDAVSIAQAGVRSSMIADGEVVRALNVAGRTMTDHVSLVAGPGVVLAAAGGTVSIGVDIGFDQYELDVSSTDAAWTTLRAVGMPYGTRDGSWHMRVNISGRKWTPTSHATLVVDGVIFKNLENYRQPLAVYMGSDSVPGIAYTLPGTGMIEISVANGSTKTYFNLTADLELDGPPSLGP